MFWLQDDLEFVKLAVRDTKGLKDLEVVLSRYCDLKAQSSSRLPVPIRYFMDYNEVLKSMEELIRRRRLPNVH